MGIDPVCRRLGELADDYHARALAAERRAKVLGALLGCAVPILMLEEHGVIRAEDYSAIRPWVVAEYLVEDPRKLMQIVPETRDLIEAALAEVGLGLEDLKQ